MQIIVGITLSDWKSRRPGLQTWDSVSENKRPAWTYCDHGGKQTNVC